MVFFKINLKIIKINKWVLNNFTFKIIINNVKRIGDFVNYIKTNCKRESMRLCILIVKLVARYAPDKHSKKA